MFWTVLVPHLTVSTVFLGLLLRALWRYEHRVDAIIAKLEEDDAASQCAFDVAREEIKASMRAQVDAAISEMEMTLEPAKSGLQMMNHTLGEPLADTDTDAPTDTQTQTAPH